MTTKKDKLHPHLDTSFGAKRWYLNGKLHREDGPAMEFAWIKLWYWHGKQVNCKTQEEFERHIKMKAFW